MPSSFDRGMRLMRKHNPQLQEDGFGLVKSVAADHIDQLIAAFESEPEADMKRWLLELIGSARSDAALGILTRELTAEDESLRYWAEVGLRDLDTKAARTVLWERGLQP